MIETKQWSDLCWLKKVIFGKQYRPNGLFWCRWQNAGWWCREWQERAREAREWQERAGSWTGCVMDSFWRHRASFIISTLCSSHLQQRCLNKQWSSGGRHQYLKWPMGKTITWWLIFLCWKGSFHYKMFAKELLKIPYFTHSFMHSLTFSVLQSRRDNF